MSSIPGILPKDRQAQARARNADRPVHPQTEFEDKPPSSAPELPYADEYTARTRRWYAAWCAAPQAQLFLISDWSRLHMLAPLVDDYFREPAPGKLAEIRNNESKLGATPEDRLRLRWRMVQNEVEEDAIERKPEAKRKRSDPRLALVGPKADP